MSFDNGPSISNLYQIISRSTYNRQLSQYGNNFLASQQESNRAMTPPTYIMIKKISSNFRKCTDTIHNGNMMKYIQMYKIWQYNTIQRILQPEHSKKIISIESTQLPLCDIYDISNWFVTQICSIIL